MLFYVLGRRRFSRSVDHCSKFPAGGIQVSKSNARRNQLCRLLRMLSPVPELPEEFRLPFANQRITRILPKYCGDLLVSRIIPSKAIFVDTRGVPNCFSRLKNNADSPETLSRLAFQLNLGIEMINPFTPKI